MDCFIHIFCSKCLDLWLIHLSLFVSGKAAANSWTKSWLRLGCERIFQCEKLLTTISVQFEESGSHLHKREESPAKWAVCIVKPCTFGHLPQCKSHEVLKESSCRQNDQLISQPFGTQQIMYDSLSLHWYLSSIHNQMYRGLLWIRLHWLSTYVSLILSINDLSRKPSSKHHRQQSNAAKSSNPSGEAMTWHPDVDLKSDRILDKFTVENFNTWNWGMKSAGGLTLPFVPRSSISFALTLHSSKWIQSICGAAAVGINTSSVGIVSVVTNDFAQQKISTNLVGCDINWALLTHLKFLNFTAADAITFAGTQKFQSKHTWKGWGCFNLAGLIALIFEGQYLCHSLSVSTFGKLACSHKSYGKGSLQ